jgi:predicted DNA-binding protein (MmcQ/YjbR family)
LAKAGAVEEEPWPDDKAWKVGGKIFCIGGGNGVSVKSTLEKQAALILHPAIKKAPYVGRFGWVMIEIKDKDTLGIALDLIDESYDLVTKKKAKSPARPSSNAARRGGR